MKLGDRVTAKVDNRTPDGLTVEGEVVGLTADTMTVATQFGVNMTLPRPADAPPEG